MKNLSFPLHQLTNFPKLFTDYISKNHSLQEFYGNYPDLDGFKKQIETKKFSNRTELVSALKSQYGHITNKPDINILAQENTFTVTTGHQLNIFTGPLYVIYKIVSTINLAKKLKVEFPAYNFVPIYWMAAEDHDFDEISYFNLFSQKYQWQTEQKGAVGRMQPAEALNAIADLKDKPELFLKAYGEQSTLANAVRYYMHELFGNQGLICVDGDNKILKSLFSDIMAQDILNQASEKPVSENSQKLEKLGYKTQISARSVNFFKLDTSFRERIDFKEGTYTVNNTDLSPNKAELEAELKAHPDKFSPNVVLRPLYQETILPNLAYLGGPSEVAYWLQLKGVFDLYNVTYPILMPRNFGLIVNQATAKKLEKLELNIEEIFHDESTIKKNYVDKNSSNALSIDTELISISEAFDAINNKANEVDATLKASFEAEKSKIMSMISNLEKRIKKAEEKKFETSINQILSIKSKLFPDGGLQERSENFLNFAINDPEFIVKVSQAFDPLSFDFNIIYT